MPGSAPSGARDDGDRGPHRALRSGLALLLAWVGALAVVGGTGVPAEAQEGGNGTRQIVVVELDRDINQVTARYLSRALDTATDDAAELVIIRLDTPGGLVDAMRDMVGDIFAARVPVVVYVAPSGARAASAGTFITAAAGFAAMAPATNIGAASVVDSSGDDLPDTLSRKANQDAAALLRSIADRRGRNADALQAAVFDAKAYSASEAVDLHIVDLVAEDMDDLLARLDGRAIPFNGGTRTVETSDARLRTIDLNFFEQLLDFLSNPTIAFLLVSLGGLLLVVEIFNLGMVVPGVLGVASLVLGFAGLGQLPFSWAGVAMIGIAMGLFVAEAHAPGIGFFGVAGTVALVLGGLFLVGFFGTPAAPGSPTPEVNRWVIAAVAGAIGATLTALAWQLRRAQTGPGYVSPLSHGALIGQTARVTRRLDPSGEVHVGGEFWEATLPPDEVAEIDEPVRVVGLNGLVLDVARLDVADRDPVPGAGTSPDDGKRHGHPELHP
jgi:membrane-bound serine protease (ClpP class)